MTQDINPSWKNNTTPTTPTRPMSYVEFNRLSRLVENGSIGSYRSEAIQRWSEMASAAGYTELSIKLAELAKLYP